MTISLGRTLPYDSSSLPGAQWDRADPRVYATRFAPAWPCSRWGLPGRSVTTYAGGLLHHLFTLTSCEAVCFLWPFSGKRRSVFCGPFPASCPAPDVIRHLALRSADFPRPGHAVPRSSDQPDLLIITDFLNLCEKSFVFRRQEQSPVFDPYIVIIKR